MSKSMNQLQCGWKSIESQIRGDLSHLTFEGKPITGENRKIAEALTMLWLVWDGSAVSFSGTHLTCFKRWWNSVLSISEVNQILLGLKRASDLLVINCEESRELNYDSFKHCLAQDCPEIGVLLSPIKEIIAAALRHDLIAFRYAYTDLRFLRKLNLTSELLEAQALDAYLSVEESMGEPMTHEEKGIIERWFPKTFKSTLYENVTPHHGTGNTADAGSDLMAKYHLLGSNSKIHLFCQQAGLKEWQGPKVSPTSKTVFVPKTFDSYRTIGEEPATLMWYQEGINDAIVRRIHESPLGRRFDPRDQNQNREAARLGSLDTSEDSLCTIDLSSASDLVSLRHIEVWFHDSALYLPLICTRSTGTILPNGRWIELKKFAPMGSAVNFSVESIVFAAIVEAAIEQQGDSVSKSRYRVYGDDIVVERKYFRAVCDRLALNGFRVNLSKSFSGTGPMQFRESCGSFWLNGIDVSPLQISRKFSGFSGRKSSWVPAAIKLANECILHPEARFLRLWLIKKLISLPKDIRPVFDSDGTLGICSDNPTNYHLSKVYNEDLQEWEVICGLTDVKLGYYDEDIDGSILLYEWLRRAEQVRPYPTRSSRLEHPMRLDPIEDPVSKPRPVLSDTKMVNERRGIRWASRSLIVFDAGE